MDAATGDALKNAGILYLPDYIINAGGVINCGLEVSEGKYDLPTITMHKRPSNYMILAIISLVCWPVGLVAIFFASRVKARFNCCNFRGAIKASRYARNLAILGILLFAVVMVAGDRIVNKPTNHIMKVQKSSVPGVKTKDLIGTAFSGYSEQRTLQDKLGFWSGSQHTYEGGRFSIERWENEQLQEIWLVLLENQEASRSIIRDILTFKNTTGGDIGPFQVFNNQTNELSDYMMVQFTSDNRLVQIYDVNPKRKKIISKKPDAHWGEVSTEWDSY
jgi:hypothetical protein